MVGVRSDHDAEPRPRLPPGTPVLDRPGGVLQVGTGAGALLLDARARPLLAVLDGRSRRESLAARSGLPGEATAAIVDALAAAGLLAPRRPARAPVAVFGEALAERLAARLAAAGVAAEAYRHPVACTLPDPPAGATLALLAPAAAEVDRAITDTFTRDGLAQLIITVGADRARVGPLVLPGRSPCLRCLDLTRADRDPAWPTHAARLAALPTEPAPALIEWAFGTALAAILAHQAGARPAVLGGMAELTVHDWLPVHRGFGAHPACGCGCDPAPGIGQN